MNIHQTIYRLPLCLLGFIIFSSSGTAQVFESGPSDPSMFDNVINLPDDQNIITGQSAGGDGSTTRINVTSGGIIGSAFDALSGIEINVTGGLVGTEFDAFSGSEVNISAGSIGTAFDANSGSEVNISGGSISAGFDAFSGSVVNISGGEIGNDFDALSGSQINLFGSDFLLDGLPLEEALADLKPAEALTIVDRDVTLTGIYADGSPFSFDLTSVFAADQDFFSSGATLTVTLGPPGGNIILGDVNQDQVVDLLDIAPFIEALITNSFSEQADLNQDGAVNFLDIQPFINILSAS